MYFCAYEIKIKDVRAWLDKDESVANTHRTSLVLFMFSKNIE